MPGPTDDRLTALLALLFQVHHRQLIGEVDPEQARRDASAALLAYIDDHRVTQAFERIERWSQT